MKDVENFKVCMDYESVDKSWKMHEKAAGEVWRVGKVEIGPISSSQSAVWLLAHWGAPLKVLVELEQVRKVSFCFSPEICAQLISESMQQLVGTYTPLL